MKAYEIWICDEVVDVIWASSKKEALAEAIRLYGANVHVQEW
jgi:hypothetical protein